MRSSCLGQSNSKAHAAVAHGWSIHADTHLLCLQLPVVKSACAQLVQENLNEETLPGSLEIADRCKKCQSAEMHSQPCTVFLLWRLVHFFTLSMAAEFENCAFVLCRYSLAELRVAVLAYVKSTFFLMHRTSLRGTSEQRQGCLCTLASECVSPSFGSCDGSRQSCSGTKQVIVAAGYSLQCCCWRGWLLARLAFQLLPLNPDTLLQGWTGARCWSCCRQTTSPCSQRCRQIFRFVLSRCLRCCETPARLIP